jgi:hypothetical protein
VLAGQRNVQGLAQRAGPLPANHPHGARLGVQRVAQHLGQAQRPGDRLRPAGELDRILIDAAHHPHRRQGGVRPSQLGGWAQRFEQRDGIPRGGDGRVTLAP